MTHPTHPKAIEAQAQADERKKNRLALKKLVERATEEGIRFVEIAPFDYSTGKPAKHGRMTIAYLVHHRNVVMVATALCHPDDTFDKLRGRAIAAVNLFDQRAILMRLPIERGQSMKTALASAFTHHTYN